MPCYRTWVRIIPLARPFLVLTNSNNHTVLSRAPSFTVPTSGAVPYTNKTHKQQIRSHSLGEHVLSFYAFYVLRISLLRQWCVCNILSQRIKCALLSYFSAICFILPDNLRVRLFLCFLCNLD